MNVGGGDSPLVNLLSNNSIFRDAFAVLGTGGEIVFSLCLRFPNFGLVELRCPGGEDLLPAQGVLPFGCTSMELMSS